MSDDKKQSAVERIYNSLRNSVTDNTNIANIVSDHTADAAWWSKNAMDSYKNSLLTGVGTNTANAIWPSTTSTEMHSIQAQQQAAIEHEVDTKLKGEFYTQLFDVWGDIVPNRMRPNIVKALTVDIRHDFNGVQVRMQYAHYGVEHPAELVCNLTKQEAHGSRTPNFRDSIEVFLVKLVMLNG